MNKRISSAFARCDLPRPFAWYSVVKYALFASPLTPYLCLPPRTPERQGPRGSRSFSGVCAPSLCELLALPSPLASPAPPPSAELAERSVPGGAGGGPSSVKFTRFYLWQPVSGPPPFPTFVAKTNEALASNQLTLQAA